MKAVLGFMAAGVLSCVAAAAAGHQRNTDQPQFETASVKPNESATGFNVSIQAGRVRFLGITVRQLLVRAYGVEPFDIAGEPAWASTERFDVIAVTSTGSTVPEINLMLRALLAERFHLVARVEKRESSVYFLVGTRDDDRLGPSIRPAADDACERPAAPAGAGASPSSNQPCRLLVAPGAIEATGQPLRALVLALGSIVGRPVVDMTALFGRYDFKLMFTPERAAAAGLRESQDQAVGNAPSIFTALQEQLGLKLEQRRGPVETLIVDHIERPDPD